MQPRKAVLSFVALIASGYLVSCESSEAKTTGASCPGQCSCQGKPGDAACIEDCQMTLTGAESDAATAGCTTEFDAFQTCLAESSLCDNQKKDLVVPVNKCGAKIQALLDCEFPVIPGDTTTVSSSSGTSTGTSM